MRTDVKSLISALTTERDSLDRAIASLRAISNGAEPEKVAPVRRVKARPRRSDRIPDDVRAEVVAQMRQSGGSMISAARRVSRQFGLHPMTVYSGWKVWARSLERLPTHSTPSHAEAAPVELSAAN